MSKHSRSDDPSKAPYRVEYAVRVWKQLFDLTPDHIALLGRELQQLADVAPGQRAEPGAGPRNLHVADLAVSYEISKARRVLTVLTVGRKQPASD